MVGMGLTPLIVAAARGMPKVVAYLLQSGASPSVKGSGRFHLFSKRSKSIKLERSTALEFSLAMKEAELHHGLLPNDCKSLNKCIRLLQIT
jgi:ankyrin repeat protein